MDNVTEASYRRRADLLLLLQRNCYFWRMHVAEDAPTAHNAPAGFPDCANVPRQNWPKKSMASYYFQNNQNPGLCLHFQKESFRKNIKLYLYGTIDIKEMETTKQRALKKLVIYLTTQQSIILLPTLLMEPLGVKSLCCAIEYCKFFWKTCSNACTIVDNPPLLNLEPHEQTLCNPSLALLLAHQ